MRLVTRSDFDGLACAVLLVEAGIVDEYMFVHPKDVQDGKVKVTKNDILANVPYAEGCALWFDHHSSEEERLRLRRIHDFQGESRESPSCARIIYDYYGGSRRFSRFDETGLMAAVDKSDSAAFTADDILNPSDWILLSFIMDARTGLGRYRDYRISNLALMEDMISYCRTMTASEILGIGDVVERVKRYWEQEDAYEEMIRKHSFTKGNVLLIDLHDRREILSGNRFKEYVMFPEQNVSVRVIWGRNKENMVITVGHSILKRTCKTDVGRLMLRYGGGGHKAVGTCQVPAESWESSLFEIVRALRADQEDAQLVVRSKREKIGV